MFVHTIIVYTLFVMNNIKLKCGCGNTQNPNGYCDGSHARQLQFVWFEWREVIAMKKKKLP